MGYIEELRALVGHRPLILTGAVAIVVDSTGRVLLQQRRHPHGMWGLPGGLMELGESVEDTVRREVWEETGLTIGNLNLLGIVSGPENFVQAANGDQFYVVAIAYVTRQFQGEPFINDEESLDLRFVDVDTFSHPIVKSHRQILDMYLSSK